MHHNLTLADIGVDYYYKKEIARKAWAKLNNIEDKLETLESLTDYMSLFLKGTISTVELYHSGELENARKNTIEIVDSLGWIVDGVHLLKEYLDINVISIQRVLQELENALKNNDDVQVADIFDNELVPKLQNWAQIMTEAVESANVKK